MLGLSESDLFVIKVIAGCLAAFAVFWFATRWFLFSREMLGEAVVEPGVPVELRLEPQPKKMKARLWFEFDFEHCGSEGDFGAVMELRTNVDGRIEKDVIGLGNRANRVGIPIKTSVSTYLFGHESGSSRGERMKATVSLARLQLHPRRAAHIKATLHLEPETHANQMRLRVVA
jgi:hypothetical protein